MRLISVLGCVLLLSGLPARAFASDHEGDAETSYRSAIAAYDQHDYADALQGFQHAYSLKPSYKILYNIGLSEVALDDSAHALDAFEGYLREGAGKIPDARVSELKQTIAKLKAKVGEISITEPDEAARVTLDGQALSSAALGGPVRVSPGAHRVCATDRAGSEQCQSVRVSAGAESALVFAEGPAQPSPAETSGKTPRAEPPAREPPRDAARETRSHAGRWIAWSAAGAFVAGAAVTGVLALNAHSDEKNVEKTQGISTADLDRAQDKVSHLALATDLLLAGAAVSAGIGLYLQLSSNEDESPKTAVLAVGPARVDFALRF